MDIEVIKDQLEERASNGKIKCSDALAVAEDLDVKPTGFAQILNDMDIKLVQCQLSCFK